MDLEKAYNKIDNFCCSNHNTLQGNKVRYLNDREETIDMFRDYQETKDDDFCKDAKEMVEALETIEDELDSSEKMRNVILELIDIDPYNVNCVGQCIDVVRTILKANISKDINHKCKEALEWLRKL